MVALWVYWKVVDSGQKLVYKLVDQMEAMRVDPLGAQLDVKWVVQSGV